MDWGYGFNESGYTDGDVTCVQGDCFEPGYSSFDPMVVVGDINFDENASGPGFNGPACGDDPSEVLLREYETGQFDPDVNTFACTDKPNKCVHNGTVYEEGSMLNAGEGRPIDEDIRSSPDREVCLGVNDEVPGSSWHEIDDWSVTLEMRDRIEDETGGLSSYSSSDLQGVLDSDEWIQEWRFHKDTEALNESGENPGANWMDDVDHEGPVAVPSTLQKPIGGFTLEDNCEDSISYDCQDISSPVDPEKMFGNFTSRGVRPDDYEDGSHPFSLDIIHNRMAFSTSGDVGIGAGNDQDTETNVEITEDFHKSNVSEKFNQWAYSPDLSYGVGPFGGVYDQDSCYGMNRQPESDINKTERLFANSFVTPEGYWIDPDETERTVTEGGISCDLTGDDKGIGYDTGGEVVIH